jgi:curved DNA-binding protein CbpA
MIFWDCFRCQPDEVKEAGRKLLKFYHPDKNANNPDYDSENFTKFMKLMKR